MKKFFVVVWAVVLLALDWLALDDITTGNEGDYFGEYAVLGISLVFFLLLGSVILRGKLHRIAKP